MKKPMIAIIDKGNAGDRGNKQRIDKGIDRERCSHQRQAHENIPENRNSTPEIGQCCQAQQETHGHQGFNDGARFGGRNFQIPKNSFRAWCKVAGFHGHKGHGSKCKYAAGEE